MAFETRLPPTTRNGSALSNKDLTDTFNFTTLLFDNVVTTITYDRLSAWVVLKSYCYVLAFAVKISRYFITGNFLEVKYVQPETKRLLQRLCKLLLDDDTCVQCEIPYRSNVFRVSGKMDSGVFLKGCDACFLSNEDKRMDQRLTDANVCQAAAELAGSVEKLSSGLAFNPQLFNSLLNSGREWKLLRRVLVDGQAVWQYTSSSLFLFNQHGEVSTDAVRSLTRLLLHCFWNARKMMKLARVPLTAEVGDLDVDNTEYDDRSSAEADDENRSPGTKSKHDGHSTSPKKLLGQRRHQTTINRGRSTKGGQSKRSVGMKFSAENLRYHEALTSFQL